MIKKATHRSSGLRRWPLKAFKGLELSCVLIKGKAHWELVRGYIVVSRLNYNDVVSWKKQVT